MKFPAILAALGFLVFPQASLGEDVKSEDTYVVNVVPGFPPLDNVDDPHPADLHFLEGNFFTQGEHYKNKNTVDIPYFDLNYGIAQGLQLKWEGWYRFQKDGPLRSSGFGNNLVGVKWMFFDSNNLSVAVYPQVQFSPSSRSIKRGLADPGPIYVLPLLISKEFQIDGRPYAVTVNAGYKYGRGGPDSRFESIGLGTAVTHNSSVMLSASN